MTCKLYVGADTGTRDRMGLVRVQGRCAQLASSDNDAAQKSYEFVVVADPQLGMTHANAGWDDDVKLCNAMVAQINARVPPPEFVVVVGDLAHAHRDIDGDELQHTAEAQHADFKRCFDQLSCATFVLPGNHDVGNVVKRSNVREYTDRYGDDFYTFWAPNKVWCVVLNSQYLVDPGEEQSMKEEHETWMKQALKEGVDSGAKAIFVFMHVPPFLRDADEPDLLETVSHWKTFAIPDGYFHLSGGIRRELLQLFDKFHVSAVFCGHWHQNNAPGTRYNNIEVIITSAACAQLSLDTKPGFRVIQVSETGSSYTHEYIEIKQ
ncbi:Serine/threonine-protein phosphatase CPPED1 [Porphyridium purpureum]|uniref:Serine/threonine-protein phosphatase CPPED1 n=1 Tax=Porphyridium purpureum TaxID=35688 RepID=A0A5J4YTM6_PORPP|nr:Serine/threonine-protein phosphatase CPPED1 [Porphyridium purpureum]|eukprot:POR0203..scf227_4